jgi:hypothetical protein
MGDLNFHTAKSENSSVVLGCHISCYTTQDGWGTLHFWQIIIKILRQKNFYNNINLQTHLKLFFLSQCNTIPLITILSVARAFQKPQHNSEAKKMISKGHHTHHGGIW